MGSGARSSFRRRCRRTTGQASLSVPSRWGLILTSSKNGRTEFDQFTESPLAPLLPSGTVASLAVPLNDVDGTPALLLILTSTDQHFQFVGILFTLY